MKKIFISIFSLLVFMSAQAQANLFNEAFRFTKFMDQVNTPEGKKLSYQDIEGNPYFERSFATANIENATTGIKSRYNSYTDTVELLTEESIFELPRSEKYSRIVFTKAAATLLYVNLSPDTEGYYFELVPGKYQLLKKMKAEYRAGQKAVNSFTPAIEPRFDNLDPVYYVKYDQKLTKIGKKEKDLLQAFPSHTQEIQQFLKKNRLKLTQESDLIKLVTYLNSLS